jgi:hypothetical protein
MNAVPIAPLVLSHHLLLWHRYCLPALAEDDPKSCDKFVCTMALLVPEILSVRRVDEGVDEKAQLHLVFASCRYFLCCRWFDFAVLRCR